jgi:outer membrane protein TolC
MSFDVVDAESLLTQARAQLETALYDLVIAKATLHAAGAESYALARD